MSNGNKIKEFHLWKGRGEHMNNGEMIDLHRWDGHESNKFRQEGVIELHKDGRRHNKHIEIRMANKRRRLASQLAYLRGISTSGI